MVAIFATMFFFILGAPKNRLIDTALLNLIFFLYFKDISFTVVSFIMMKEVCCCLVVTADVYTDFSFCVSNIKALHRYHFL